MGTTFGEDLRKIMLAGIGAVATTVEKSKVIIDSLIQKGELTVEQGKVLNEELKKKVTTTLDNLARPTTDEVLDSLSHMTPEELDTVKEKIATMGKEDSVVISPADEDLKE